MNRNLAMTFGKQFVTGAVVPMSTRLMVTGAAAVCRQCLRDRAE